MELLAMIGRRSEVARWGDGRDEPGLPAALGLCYMSWLRQCTSNELAYGQRLESITWVANARVAQWIERLTSDQEVASSSLAAGTSVPSRVKLGKINRLQPGGWRNWQTRTFEGRVG